MKYRREIDGLRALAVLSVVLYHAFPSVLKGGFIGVDVFFVISGYLITRIIFEQLDNKTFSFTSFFGRRVRRIFPALILVMTASLIFGWFALLADEYAQLGKHIASGAAFIINFILVNESGYFDNAAETKPMLHLWSLAVEEQFYIIWPLMLWLAWKKKFNLLTITIVVAIASFVLNLKFVESKPIETFFWPVGRIWELLSGSVLAWFMLYKRESLSTIKLWLDEIIVRVMYSREEKSDGKTVSNLMSLVGILILAFGIFRINKDIAFPGMWALFPVSGALLIIAAGSKAWLNRALLMNPVAVWFGLISYPLYLWHWPILSFLHVVEGHIPSREVRLIAVITSIVLAWITWLIIETYFRSSKNARHKAIFLYVAMFLLATVAFFTYNQKGFPERASISALAKAQVDISFTRPKHSNLEFCSNITKSTYCISDVSEPTVAILGDSHALATYDGLNDYIQEKGQQLILLGHSGCPPFIEIERINKKGEKLGCAKAMSRWLEYISKSENIKTVFLTARAAYYYNSDGFGIDANRQDPRPITSTRSPTITDTAEILTNSIRRTLDVLAQSNKQVVYLHDVPELGFNIKDCLPSHPFNHSQVNNRTCRLNRTDFEQRYGNYEILVNNILSEYPNAQSLRLSDPLCDDHFCYGKLQDTYLYRDDDHLSKAGSKFVFEALKPQLNSLF